MTSRRRKKQRSRSRSRYVEEQRLPNWRFNSGNPERTLCGQWPSLRTV